MNFSNFLQRWKFGFQKRFQSSESVSNGPLDPLHPKLFYHVEDEIAVKHKNII